MRERIVFLMNSAIVTGYSHAKKRTLIVTSYYIVNSKRTVDLKVRTKILKLLEENIGENISGVGGGCSMIFSCIPYHKL